MIFSMWEQGRPVNFKYQKLCDWLQIWQEWRIQNESTSFQTLTDRVKLSYISVSWPYSKYKWNHEPLEEDKEVRERERRWVGNQWTVNNVTRNVLTVFEYIPVWLRKKNENTEQTLLPIPSLHYKLPFVCDSSSLSKSCPLVVKRGSVLSCPWIFRYSSLS